MKINDRLKKISEMTLDNSYILDIGCDHGLLDIYLVKNKKNVKVIASDILKTAINGAKENIKKYKVKNIELVVSDGLDAYKDGVDSIIISGMGGKTIISILNKNKKILKNINNIIVSPNNYQDEVRKYLNSNNFYIDDEELVESNKYIYQIISFKKGNKKYNYKDYYFGPINRIKKSNNFYKYFNKELTSLNIILKMLPSMYILKKIKIKFKIKMIKNELNY